jgi:BolA protein
MSEHPMQARIRAKLTAGLAPSALEIIDDSHRHAGHSGHRDEGGTHYSVHVTADAFVGLNRVARQRLVYDLLADELATGLHALALTISAPGDPSR